MTGNLPAPTHAPTPAPGAERRAEVRYPCREDSACVLVVSQRHAARWARPRDVSTDGLSLSVAGPLEAGSLALVELSCGGSPLTLLVEVVRAVPQPDGTWTVGCRYDNLRGDLGLAERTQVQELLRRWGPTTDAHAQEEAHSALTASLRNPLRPLLKRGRPLSRPVEELTRWDPGSADQFYDLLHITRNKFRARKEVTDLTAVIGRALELVRPQVAREDDWAEATLPPAPLHLEADADGLEWAVSRLIHTMVRHVRPGSRIRLSAERDGREGVLTIAGEQITQAVDAPPTLADLLDGTRAAGLDGDTISLALVRALVEMHGGSVRARMAGPDHGQFVVRLPILAATERD